MPGRVDRHPGAVTRRLVLQGLSVSEVARRLGVGVNCLRNWRNAFRDEGPDAFPGHGVSTPADEELRRLRAENQRLIKAERDLLKKPPPTSPAIRRVWDKGYKAGGATKYQKIVDDGNVHWLKEPDRARLYGRLIDDRYEKDDAAADNSLVGSSAKGLKYWNATTGNEVGKESPFTGEISLESQCPTRLDALNVTRRRDWAEQPDDLFACATVDLDGTLTPTTGQCKQGMDISYNGVWGYHPLIVSLANTGEILSIVNRSGNRSGRRGRGRVVPERASRVPADRR